MKAISLELNEVNFEFIRSYIEQGELPHFADLLKRYELFETEAERTYPHLEPWIQWPTVYTGKDFQEHGLFRLGDCVEHDHPQLWDILESNGVSVGAISPMNAVNRCRHADFFVPDPWTQTPATGDAGVRALSDLVAQAVNENATGGLSTVQLAQRLLPHLLRFGRLASLKTYLASLWQARRYKWGKAAVLDRFLADVFLKLRARKETQFSSLFLNAAAHIQHHHMFEAKVYDGTSTNPTWYSSAGSDGVDPLLHIYRVYDNILGDMLALKDVRLFVTTGLSQIPNKNVRYQYRFKAHADTIAALNIGGARVLPRMSRDFLLEFDDAGAASAARARMAEFSCAGEPFFAVEDRGMSLFCQVSYFGPPEGLTDVRDGERVLDMSGDLALVSIENGIHQTVGYHVDTWVARGAAPAPQRRIPLKTVFSSMVGQTPVPAHMPIGAAA